MSHDTRETDATSDTGELLRYDTREAWLRAAMDILRPKFEAHAYPLPAQLHVSIGFPARGGMRGRRGVTMGQCWGSRDGCDASSDKAPHIFISPLHDGGIAVLDTLMHELTHAALPPGAKHGAKFVRACNALGLTADKPKSRRAGVELLRELERLNADLGTFPHAALDAKSLPKAQGTRLLKVKCASDEYVVRVTRAWLAFGAPICPMCNEPMEEA